MEAGARVVATGRSDLGNQVNNSSVFPGLFRGVLDVRAARITDSMTRAAAHALAHHARRSGLKPDAILPRMDDLQAAAEVAAAVGLQAQHDGVAAMAVGRDKLLAGALQTIRAAQEANKRICTPTTEP